MTLPKLYVECNPLLDILADVPDDFIAKFKVERGSATLVTDDQKSIFAELEAMPNVMYLPGGSGLNTARCAQWVLQAPKSTFASYVGCIADDRYGKIIREKAEDEGVTMALEYTTKEVTGSCAVCITGKERSLVANLGAANCLSGDHLRSEEVQRILSLSKIFFLTGFTLTIDVNHVLLVAQKAREVDGIFCLNLSAPFIIEFFGDQLKQVMPYVDVIFSNEVEAHVLAKVHGWDTEDLSEIALRALQELPYSGTKDRMILFTHGAQPIVCATKAGAVKVPVPKVEDEKIIDLNGAGDAFVGGFLAAFALGRNAERCCEVGTYAAQFIIQQHGCSLPGKPEITI